MLSGKRLGLRPLQTEDVWPLYKWFNDKRVTEDMGAQHTLFYVSLDEEKRAVEKKITSNSERDFIIQLLDGGAPIGLISLNKIDLRNGSAEMQLIIGESKEWGKGYGKEATRLLQDYAFNVLNMHRIHLRVPEYNKRAIACAKGSGFRKDGTFRDDHFHLGAFMSSHLMSILREEFEALP
jgi:RimJ/RimL family protein N-acetyltransferase